MEDILTVVYQYLSVIDINKCMQVNHQFYRASKYPLVWSILLNQYYDNQYTNFKQDILEISKANYYFKLLPHNNLANKELYN